MTDKKKVFVTLNANQNSFELNIDDDKHMIELVNCKREMVVIDGHGPDPVPMGTFNFEVKLKQPIEIPTNKIVVDDKTDHKYTRLNINIKNTFGKYVKANFDNSIELVNLMNSNRVMIPKQDVHQGNISTTKFQFHNGERILVDASTEGTLCELKEFYTTPKRTVTCTNILTDKWLLNEEGTVLEPILIYEEEDDTP